MATVQSIERAFQLLEAVAPAESGLSDLAARVSLPKSTVARLLKTLEGLGAVERVESGRYRIGRGIKALAGTGHSAADLASRARPHLRSLAGTIGEDAGLSLPDGYNVHYIAQEDAGNDVQVRDWTGAVLPMHANSSGLVILAHWPDDALDRFLDRDLEAFTAHTVVDPAAIRRRLSRVRAEGHAWASEEFVDGINSVAAPVLDGRDRVVAAVHVHGPAYRYPADGEQGWPAGRVMEAAASIGNRIAGGDSG